MQTQFNFNVRVYYEDTDAGGVVYHSNYLNFMERARTEWLRALGFDQTQLKEELGIVIVVHSLEIAFKSPARLNDLLQINCQLIETGHSSLNLAQTITRIGNGPAENVVLTQARVKAAFIHAHTFKPVRMPHAIKHAMLNQD